MPRTSGGRPSSVVELFHFNTLGGSVQHLLADNNAASTNTTGTSNNGTHSRDRLSVADRSRAMRVLFVGDVVGKPGRQAIGALVPAIKRESAIDLVIVNGENAAGGAGLTGEIAREIHDAGADVITNGNHVWDQRSFLKEIDALEYCVRPLNLPPPTR